MIDYEVDYELIRETFVKFGERMEALGFPKMLEDIEGSGKIGKCVRDPRDASRIKVLVKYLKSLGKDLLEEERELRAQGKVDPSLLEAKQALEECYQTLKMCVIDTQSPKQAAELRSQQANIGKKNQPTMRAPVPQQRQALPSSGALVPTQLTPAQLAQLQAMQNQGRVLHPAQVISPVGGMPQRRR